jgi:hypothetical protein
MEDIVDLIKENAISTAAFLELPTEDELILIEEEILLPIPRELKSFLLQVSDVVLGSLEPVTVADPGAHTHLSEVTCNAWAIGLPRELMVVCKAGEEYYCITQEGNIKLWCDGEYLDEGWEDIWQWAEQIWVSS